jgi:ABC-2 type transport system permease protein
MKALVDAELLKLRSTRTVAGLVLASLCLSVLAIVTNVPTVGQDDVPLSLDDSVLLARIVGLGIAVPEVLMALLGVLAFTQEFRYGTASSTYLVMPDRARVLAAKWAGLALASVPVTALSLLVPVVVGIPLILSRDGNATAGAEFWQVVAAAFLTVALYGVMGVAIGALIRNQIAAVVSVLVWMLAVEQILVTSYPAIGKWMPTGASFGLLQLGPLGSTEGALLAAPIGGLVLAGYTVVACVLALIVTPKRDVL